MGPQAPPSEPSATPRPAWAWRIRDPRVALGVLFVAAFFVRALLWRTGMYGDEAVLFYLSRHPAQNAPHVNAFDQNYVIEMAKFFWWRMLFRVAYIPAALAGFDAYRLFHILLSSALAPLVFALLRAYQARRAVAWTAAVVVAVHPVFVVWGSIVFPDMPMVVAFAAGLLLRRTGRPLAMGAAFAAAILFKEVAAVGVAFLGAVDLARDLRAGRATLWPLRLPPTATAYPYAVVAGMAPLMVYLQMGGQPPGWSVGGASWALVDDVFLLAWFAPVLVAGLAWPRTRVLAALGLVYPVFYLYYGLALGRGVEVWYMVQPGLLALVGAALVVDEALVRAARRPGPAARRAAAGIAVALALLVAVQVVAPESSAANAALTRPIGHDARMSLPESIRFEQARHHDVRDLADRLSAEDRQRVFLVDVEWFFVFFPYAEIARDVRFSYTLDEWVANETIPTWAALVEGSNATVVHTEAQARALNLAIRDVYADCVAEENPTYVLIRGGACAGRADGLAAAYGSLRWG